MNLRNNDGACVYLNCQSNATKQWKHVIKGIVMESHQAFRNTWIYNYGWKKKRKKIHTGQKRRFHRPGKYETHLPILVRNIIQTLWLVYGKIYRTTVCKRLGWIVPALYNSFKATQCWSKRQPWCFVMERNSIKNKAESARYRYLSKRCHFLSFKIQPTLLRVKLRSVHPQIIALTRFSADFREIFAFLNIIHGEMWRRDWVMDCQRTNASHISSCELNDWTAMNIRKNIN